MLIVCLVVALLRCLFIVVLVLDVVCVYYALAVVMCLLVSLRLWWLLLNLFGYAVC